MVNKELSGINEEVEIEDISEEEDLFPERYLISSYGADYVVDSLVKRIQSGDIYIPPFQRQFIWTQKQSSRFIESLLLGLPVPGIFLSKDDDTKKLVVIDGQQRLRSLQFFYEGIFANTGKQFTLVGVQKKFEGKSYKSISPEDVRELNDAIIHATIIRQDAPQEDNTSVLHIFERLNTSGTPLTHQEIRATMYSGELNTLLEELNENNNWRKIFGRKSPRRKDQELILRFFSLRYNYQSYSPPMRNFLNAFMAKNRHLQIIGKEDLKNIFVSVVDLINNTLTNKAFRLVSGLNAAVYDAVMVGLSKRLLLGKITDTNAFLSAYNKLIKSEKFLKAIETGTTAQASSVKSRIDEATKAFQPLK